MYSLVSSYISSYSGEYELLFKWSMVNLINLNLSLMSLRSQLPGLRQQPALPFLYEKTLVPLRSGSSPPLSSSIWSEHSVKKKKTCLSSNVYFITIAFNKFYSYENWNTGNTQLMITVGIRIFVAKQGNC